MTHYCIVLYRKVLIFRNFS